MKWQGRRQSVNIEDRTNDPPVRPMDGEKLVGGGVYRKPKNVKLGPDMEFDPDNPKEMKTIEKLEKINREGRNPTPTPRPSDGFTSHDNLVTPGKWRTKG